MRRILLALSLAAALQCGDDPDITAEIAVEAALDQFRQEASAKCDNCNGTGKIGDGRIVHDCPVCGGDGVKQCEGGQCPLR